MGMVVGVVLVDVAVQESLGGFGRMGVVPRLGSVVLELVGRQSSSDRRAQGPAPEAGDRERTAARAKHGARIVEYPPGAVK